MARDILAGRYSGAGDGLTPAEAFATGGGSVNAIRISLGNINDRGRLQAGLKRLSHLLARQPEPFSAAVV